MQASAQTERNARPKRFVEADLLEYVKRLERNHYEWRAAHIQLSSLRPHNRRDYQIRVAASEFDGFLANTTAELFQLRNGDFVLVWQGAAMAEVDQIVLRLRYLFSDDPLFRTALAAAPAEPHEEPAPRARFCDWFELERDFDQFEAAIQQLVSTIERRRLDLVQPQEGRPLTPVSLAQLENSLASADLSGLLRQQQVCILLPGLPPQIVFREVHFAIGDLAKRLLPGADLAADTWLFQHLAATLDRHLLSILAENAGSELREATSVNLRLSTLLSDDFLKFDQDFRRKHRVQLIIELQLVDIYAELGAFTFINHFLRERGYRLFIDGLHHLHLPLINRKRLGVDLVKLIWSPDILDETGDRGEVLKSAVHQIGRDRLILCRCDSAEAIAWGQALGIRLFQGHYVDSKLRAARSPAVAAARQALKTAPA